MKLRNQTYAQRINDMKPRDLVTVTLGTTWEFLPGKPAGNWMMQKKSGKTFRLKNNLIDLRSLLTPEEKKIEEGIVYCEFQSPEDGIAQFGMACDWWFEAYCNGILCGSTLKSGNGTAEYSPMNHPFIASVKQGKNLLAVYVKAGIASWTFACAEFSPSNPMFPPSIPILYQNPILMWPDTGSIAVAFLTFGKIGAGIEYREKSSSQWKTVWDHRHGRIICRDFHVVSLENLKPGTEYVYRAVMIDSSDPEVWNRSAEYSFRVPDQKVSKCSFFFTADLQYPEKIQQSLLKNMLKAADAESCDFLVFGGDIGSSFNPDNVIRNLFPLLPPQKPVIYMRGNHELRGSQAEKFFDYFAMPNGRSYGLFRFGNTAFMMLDSWEDKIASYPGHPYCKYNADEAFYREELDYIKPLFRSEKWTGASQRIVLCHSAPYAHAGTVIPDFLKKLTDEDLGGKNPKSRLNLWVTGHKHFHMRSIPGTDEIVAAEKPSEPAYGGKNYTYPVITVAGPSKRSAIKASAFRVDCNEKGIRVRGYADDGTLLEDLFYANDGRITVSKELKHYTVKPVH